VDTAVASQWERTAPGKGTRKLRPTDPISKPELSGTTYNPEHNRLQNRLFKLLDGKYGKSVVMEAGGVDIRIDHPDLFAFIELKTSASARLAIREAIGQILEYAHYKPGTDGRSPVLVVAAPVKAGPADLSYIELLRSRYGLDIRYVEFHRDTATSPL